MISKGLEYIINDQIVSLSHLLFHIISLAFYVANLLIVQQLLFFLKHIDHSISDGSQHDVIFLAFCKAFDSIPHNNLL